MNAGASAPATLLDWAADVVGTASFSQVQPLAGGTAAGVWRLTADTDAGTTTVVAKQAAPDAPADVGRLIGHEARILEAVRPRGLPVPEPLACDPDGICTGAPALLMSLMPGALLQGEAAVRAAIPEYVRALCLCHERCRDLLAGRRFAPWFTADGPTAPEAGATEALWRRAVDVVQRFPSPAADGFIHRDPHPMNMLFADGRLSAILDWPNAGRGPRGMDVSRVALNLACLLDVDATAELRERYEAETGTRHDPLLDIYALLESGFAQGQAQSGSFGTALGLSVDAPTIATRLEAFLADALHRMTVRRMK